MAHEPAVIDLRAPDLPFRSNTIPDSTPDVALTRLHVDRLSRASVSLVRFPAGWARPGTGSYRCAELFVVLDGEIEVSGECYRPGEYGYLPARTARADSHSRGGCLAVAWFSGPPVWSDGLPAEPAEKASLHSRLGEDDPAGVGGGARGRDRVPVGPVEAATELLWPAAGRWCLLPSGASPPPLPGPALVRRWP
jgi:hypothetical protein